MIHIGVVAQDIAGYWNTEVFLNGSGIDSGYRRIVSACDSDSQCRWRVGQSVGGLIAEGLGDDLTGSQRLYCLRGVVESIGIATICEQGEAAVAASKHAKIRHAEHGALIDIDIVTQDIAGCSNVKVFLNGCGIDSGHRRIVSAGDGNSERRWRGDQSVGGLVAEGLGDDLTGCQRLYRQRSVVQRITVTAVCGQGKIAVVAAEHAKIRHTEHSALIDIGVIAQDIAGGRNVKVFLNDSCIRYCHRSIVHPRNSNIHHAACGRALVVADGVAEAVCNRLSCTQFLKAIADVILYLTVR